MFSDNFRRGEGSTKGMAGSRALSKIADLGWRAFQAVNRAIPEGGSVVIFSTGAGANISRGI